MPNDFDRPYEIHTGQELRLMLGGTKPLAHFYDDHPADPCEEVIPEEAFAPYVKSGLFEKFEYVELLTHPPPANHPHIRGLRHVFYAIPKESWRIDVYIDMTLRLAQLGWNLRLERMQGRLLGYEDWQIEVHIDRMRKLPTAKHFRWLFEGEASAQSDT